MADFIREWSIGPISLENVLDVGQNCTSKEIIFLDSMLKDIKDPDYDYNRKLFFLNWIVAVSYINMSNKFHADFFELNLFKLPSHKTYNINGISRIARGFISNASDSLIMKYKDDPRDACSMSIRLSYYRNILMFEVDDTGKGISSEIEGILFSDLEKTTKDNTYRTKYDGIFLGGCGVDLQQANQTIKQAGGKLCYENKGLNKGARFWYELDLSA